MIAQCFGLVLPGGPPLPSGIDEGFLGIGALAQHPGVAGLFANSDTAVNSPTGTTYVTIVSVPIPAGALSPIQASPGVNGCIRHIHVSAYFAGANNSNAKTVGITFGSAAAGGLVAQCALTVSVAATAHVEADITIDSNVTQTGQGWGIAATSAVGGALTGDVLTPTALTLNMGLAQSIYFVAVTQTSASDIVLKGYKIEIY